MGTQRRSMAKRAKTSASNTKPKGRAGSSHSGDPEDPSDVAGSSLGVNIKVEVKLEDSEDESTPSSSSAPAPPPASNAASATPEYTITLEVKLEGGQERLHINIDALDPLLGPGQDDLPIPEEPFLSDKVIDPVMGGGSQVTFPTATKYGRGKKFGRLKRVWNPSLPLAPGKHGVVFVRNKDVMPLAQKILSMFGRLPGEDHKHGFRYLGEYAVFYRGKLTPEQFAALPPATKTEWINGHLEKWQKDLKDRNLPNDRADVEAALEEGELAVYFYILKFDSFDEKLHDLLLTRQRVVKEGKRSRKDTGARKQKKNGVVVSSDDQGLSQIHRRRPSAPKTTATSNSSPPTPPSTPRVLTESSSSTRPQQNLRKSSRRFTPASNVELDDMETSELSDETENHFEEATPSLVPAARLKRRTRSASRTSFSAFTPTSATPATASPSSSSAPPPTPAIPASASRLSTSTSPTMSRLSSSPSPSKPAIPALASRLPSSPSHPTSATLAFASTSSSSANPPTFAEPDLPPAKRTRFDIPEGRQILSFSEFYTPEMYKQLEERARVAEEGRDRAQAKLAQLESSVGQSQNNSFVAMGNEVVAKVEANAENSLKREEDCDTIDSKGSSIEAGNSIGTGDGNVRKEYDFVEVDGVLYIDLD